MQYCTVSSQQITHDLIWFFFYSVLKIFFFFFTFLHLSFMFVLFSVVFRTKQEQLCRCTTHSDTHARKQLIFFSCHAWMVLDSWYKSNRIDVDFPYFLLKYSLAHSWVIRCYLVDLKLDEFICHLIFGELSFNFISFEMVSPQAIHSITAELIDFSSKLHRSLRAKKKTTEISTPKREKRQQQQQQHH